MTKKKAARTKATKKKATKKKAAKKKATGLRARLDSIAGSEDFEHDSLDLVTELERGPQVGAHLQAALTFMEDNPDIDYGGPGALVHFVETFEEGLYERSLLASLERRPTLVTTMLLNRLINGTKGKRKRAPLIDAMHAAGSHRRLPADVADHVREYLERLASL